MAPLSALNRHRAASQRAAQVWCTVAGGDVAPATSVGRALAPQSRLVLREKLVATRT